MTMGKGSGNDLGRFKPNGWDKNPPNQIYFDELFRVSKQQIIWGGNYYDLSAARCYLIWDKMDYNSDFASSELAWTSFDKVVKTFRHPRNTTGKRIHPTQKPIALYRWLLENYAKEGDLILDTHVGSASSLIACEALGFDYVGFEIDKDYFEAAKKRIKDWRSLPLFDEKKKEPEQTKLAI
jgi:site-specific DNA-methyltransferase (adenine-specific)